ncbi:MULTISPECIES: glycosyltransferase family 2 protein [unclassified Embleya]|uniref:glycosyltransferase family 2 protein n=1 Tax=unclassified Embleya TaxID=2699296 RepID=UPI00340A747E
MTRTDGVSVVVITYNDATHLPAAIESALAQGDVVSEIVVVDDASTDETGQVLSRWPRDRVRVVRRTTNSGGCGEPRNDGTAFAQSGWICYLDSDDVLPPGAVEAMYRAAVDNDVDFVAGRCVRRELPEERDVAWHPHLFAKPGVYSIAERPESLWDTLAVNKLYRRSFLTENHIQFPDGAAHYEDFPFTAKVYAAARRFAVIDAPVYTWNVRRRTSKPSISLRRDRIRNWQDRVRAHADVVEIMRDTGDEHLVDAAERKFLEHDLSLYLRDLHRQEEEYRNEWWEIARQHLSTFGVRAFVDATPSARWAADVVRTRERPTAAARLAELAADPPRLVPPYFGGPETPTWDDERPAVPLSGFRSVPTAGLPIDVEASVSVTGARLALDLRIADLYGRISASGIAHVEIELRDRLGTTNRSRPATVTATAEDGFLHGRAVLDGGALRGLGAFATWDIWAQVSFWDGSATHVRVRAAGGSGLTRHMVPDLRRALLLVQPYRTANHSLGVRVADGPRGAAAVATARFRRRSGSKT